MHFKNLNHFEHIAWYDRRMKLSSTSKRILISISALALFCLAAAKGYVVSDGQGNCVTVTFNYDEKGAFIGTTSVSAKCSIPEGSYPFSIVIADKPSVSQDGREVPASSAPGQAAAFFLKQGREAAKALKDPKSPLVVRNRPYAEALADGLGRSAKGRPLTIAVQKSDALAVFAAPSKR